MAEVSKFLFGGDNIKVSATAPDGKYIDKLSVDGESVYTNSSNDVSVVSLSQNVTMKNVYPRLERVPEKTVLITPSYKDAIIDFNFEVFKPASFNNDGYSISPSNCWISDYIGGMGSFNSSVSCSDEIYTELLNNFYITVNTGANVIYRDKKYKIKVLDTDGISSVVDLSVNDTSSEEVTNLYTNFVEYGFKTRPLYYYDSSNRILSKTNTGSFTTVTIVPVVTSTRYYRDDANMYFNTVFTDNDVNGLGNAHVRNIMYANVFSSDTVSNNKCGLFIGFTMK